MFIARSSPLPADAIRGRAIGALVMIGFGALWMISAANLRKRLDWSTWLVVLLFTGILCVGAGKQLQRAQHMPTSPPSSAHTESDERIRRQFRIVLAFEWIPIFAVVFVLARMRRPELILPAIALIVGLHFIPLAIIFRARLYYFTAIAIVLTTLAALALTGPTLRQTTICVGCGLALWLTSALLLV